ncbi:MBOAT family protein [Panacibacter sp. DH6]|uniref:MBOAT family protein n=2 Tax=Panacibacter microcysteis TaxID=2793269 RepID=A0A931E460_9BACT|nr:MBOAT family protein [Panacibacter microcysteis]
MVFNSLIFVAFFIIVTTLFFVLPHKYRWFLLLIASCYFYMYFLPIYILILGFTIVVDYFAGLYIAKSEGKKRKLWLICSLIANIGVLAFFKYYNFLNFNISQVMGEFGYKNPIPHLDILLPVGLSFHTFQAMSYTIEVYRGHQKPEKHFGIYALYVMFYPQLVAGPIERPQNVIHQFYEKKYFDYDRVVSGLRLMLWGFIKKLVVADRLGIYVDAVYNNAEHHSGLSMMVATAFFGFQIYCDFSGYSDIAIGAARVMGFDLMTNFRRPILISKSIGELWQRWHISLTTWFRDYLYFPLGGNRKGALISSRNVLIVFALSGLWHGANWTFVIWGLINGLLISIERIINPVLRKIHKLLGVTANFFRCITVYIFVTISAVWFRSLTVEQGWYITKSMFTLKPGGFFKGEPPTNFYYYLFAVAMLVITEHVQEYYPNFQLIGNSNVVVRYTGYVLILTMILMVGVFNGGQFIYFQF